MGVIAANWQAEGAQLSITLFKRAYSFQMPSFVSATRAVHEHVQCKGLGCVGCVVFR